MRSRTHLLVIICTYLAVLTCPIAGTEPGGHRLLLMPMPAKLDVGQGRLILDARFRVTITGTRDPLVDRAVVRMMERLQRKTGIPFTAPGLSEDGADGAVMEIRPGKSAAPPRFAMPDESYRLEVTERRAVITTASSIGVLRAMETFLQLVDLDSQSFFIPSLTIEDRPRFPWRGLHMDVSRHWHPVEVILRNLDAMAAVKMNVFHWHLSDDQGFRIESKIYPRLHEKGSEGKFYTQEQVRRIVSYANDRGIRVVPEFDMPGHATSWLVAYPELASAPGPYSMERAWGVFDPTMDPTRESVYEFLDAFIGEMVKLFPDPYFHIGGDEVNGKQWNASETIRAFKAQHKMKSNRDLQSYFNRRLHRILAKYGKTMVGWNEVLHPDLPKETVIQSWLGDQSLVQSVRSGHFAFLSRGYYLDHMRPASFHYENDPAAREGLTPEEKTRIIGGEACMWAEFVTSENVESRIWPRAAAIAERFWSPQEVRDVKDMYRRMEHLSGELELLGLQHRNNHLQMLKRLAGRQSVGPLKTFSEQLVPTGLAVRQRIRKYYSYVPLNRMVDTLLPESETARHFGYAVERALQGDSRSADAIKQLRAMLALWRENNRHLQPLLDTSFLLSELKPLAKTVDDLNRKAFEALQYLESRRRPPETWLKAAAQLLATAEKPQAEILPATLASIKSLIDAANSIP